jgi:peptidoglycan-N-acetylglucosamine deacetylase
MRAARGEGAGELGTKPSTGRRNRMILLASVTLGAALVYAVTAFSTDNAPAVKPPGRPAVQDQARLDRFWAKAIKETYRSTGELQAQHERELRKGLRYHKLLRGNHAVRAVALTFDDGPHPQFTPRLLDILRKYNVRATFFVVGRMAECCPNLIKMEDAGGHLVANHTYHHVNLTRIPEDEVRVEWQACSDVIKSIIDKDVLFCRPPGGDYDAEVIKAADETGLTTVLWTDDPGDYASPGDKVIETRVLDMISNGGIILLHDGVQQTIDVLPQIIETLQKKGFKFQTTQEMGRGAGLI